MSERIKHDGSRRCPVEDDAIVFFSNDFGEDTCPASMINWTTISEYEIIQGWSRPLADIFAELPDEAEWVTSGIAVGAWFVSEPNINMDNNWYSFKSGRGTICKGATYYGDWRESKRKRPEGASIMKDALPVSTPVVTSHGFGKVIPSKGSGETWVKHMDGHECWFARENIKKLVPAPEPSGQYRDKQGGSNKPAPWFVVAEDGRSFHVDSFEDGIEFINEHPHSPGTRLHLCRAVASFTAKVERKDYE